MGVAISACDLRIRGPRGYCRGGCGVSGLRLGREGHARTSGVGQIADRAGSERLGDLAVGLIRQKGLRPGRNGVHGLRRESKTRRGWDLRRIELSLGRVLWVFLLRRRLLIALRDKLRIHRLRLRRLGARGTIVRAGNGLLRGRQMHAAAVVRGGGVLLFGRLSRRAGFAAGGFGRILIGGGTGIPAGGWFGAGPGREIACWPVGRRIRLGGRQRLVGSRGHRIDVHGGRPGIATRTRSEDDGRAGIIWIVPVSR